MIDNKSIEKFDDIKCDDMGAWRNNGCPKFYFTFQESKSSTTKVIAQEKTDTSGKVYFLRRIYHINNSDPDVRKIISYLEV